MIQMMNCLGLDEITELDLNCDDDDSPLQLHSVGDNISELHA